jgi:hypothetical protein
MSKTDLSAIPEVWRPGARPIRTHRGLATYVIECGKAVERALREENGVSPGELAFVIRRRGNDLPYGHTLYYSIREQQEHMQRAEEDFGTLVLYASHNYPCPCDNCNLDDDGGDR